MHKYPRFKHNVASRLLPFDPTGDLRTAGSSSNVFVRNLNKESVDHEALHELFSKQGLIKAAKVSKTMRRVHERYTCISNGYGFVNFSTDEEAKRAINQLDGETFHGNKLHVQPFSI